MGKIGLVTDSTADFEPHWYDENDVAMVPLAVRFGDDIYREWIDIKPIEFYKRLKEASELPKTSQPSVAEFLSTYQELSKSCDEIISIHISSKLSGTIGSAEIAAKEAPVPVTVIDAKQASLATGLVVREMAGARKEGANASELQSLANDIIANMNTLFYVDTLKYLEMGGRLGKAAALLGSILNIKVILKIDSGEVAPLARVRGHGKVFTTIIDKIKDVAGKEPRFGFAHADNETDMSKLKDELAAAGFDIAAAPVTTIGAVVGTYTGPGAFAVVVY